MEISFDLVYQNPTDSIYIYVCYELLRVLTPIAEIPPYISVFSITKNPVKNISTKYKPSKTLTFWWWVVDSLAQFPSSAVDAAKKAGEVHLVTETDNRRGRICGGWWPIENISDPHVKEIAEFAVSEYNEQAKGQNKLAFERVVRGDRQLVAGMNYRLVISAKNKSVADPNDATPAEYEGIVWERTRLHFKQLTSFHRLSNPN
ncbi:cysteine proteinase inhibitor 1-like isoform X1 [Malus domestica]|uniref:cysteine proteinase inhibitor 1-like isoform X1 n=1 Tax=Malus domestica TaxID=3750 RepID=UPI0004991010